MPYGIRHKIAFYDILWKMPCRIKLHKVWQYGYQMNRIDQTNQSVAFRIIFMNKIGRNSQKKNGKSNFPLYFWRNPLYCKRAPLLPLNDHRFWEKNLELLFLAAMSSSRSDHVTPFVRQFEIIFVFWIHLHIRPLSSKFMMSFMNYKHCKVKFW